MAKGPRFVLVLNGMQDILELFRMYLEQDGWSVITAAVDDIRRGEVNLQGFVDAYDPDVVVYDVQPPYDINWRYLDALRTSGPFKGKKIVVTTTNEKRVREFVDTNEPMIEIFGKPYDMQQVVEAVRRVTGGTGAT